MGFMDEVYNAFDFLCDEQGLQKIESIGDTYMACGTSALREANNSQQLVKKIKKVTGIKIDIIDGRREAEIIASSELYNLMQSDRSYLYVDVGGGSTELNLISKNKYIFNYFHMIIQSRQIIINKAL